MAAEQQAMYISNIKSRPQPIRDPFRPRFGPTVLDAFTSDDIRF
jgi:hypothetical protein